MKFIGSVVLAAGAVNAQYAASLLGNVALTTVAGNDDGTVLPVGTNIYGPFEAGFSSAQDFILAGLGCTTGKGYIDGGIDTLTAERAVAQDCGVELPRFDGDKYVSLIGQCGGHTNDYHFHERLSCLYTSEMPDPWDGSLTHSDKVGQALDGKSLYGKWEAMYSGRMPDLDACGGHWGPTPDHDSDTYHYHVQPTAPFTIGCFGPNPDNSLVTVAQCRALYTGCGDGDAITISTPEGDKEYDPWCPCFDANGSNVATVPLAFESTDWAKGPGGDSVLQKPSTSTSTKAGGADLTDDKTGSSKMGTNDKTAKAPGSMRLAEDGDDCPAQKFELRGGKKATGEYCLDASKKRLAVAKCNGKPEQQFQIDGGHIKQGDLCVSATLTMSACDKPHTVTASGNTLFNIKASNGKCFNMASKKKVAAAKCNAQAKGQKFSITPVL